MNGNNHFDRHFWSARRCTHLVQTHRLTRAVALATLRDVLNVLRGVSVSDPPTEEFLRPGDMLSTALGDRLLQSGGGSSFHSQAQQIAEEAFASAGSVNMRRLMDFLQQRFRGWQTSVERALPPAASIAAGIEAWIRSLESSDNPYALLAAHQKVSTRLAEIQVMSSDQSKKSHDEAQRCDDDMRRHLSEAEQRYENRARALTMNNSEKREQRLSAPRLCALAGFFTFLVLFALLSQTWLVAVSEAAAAVVATLIGLKIADRRRQRQESSQSESRNAALAQMARQVFGPIKDELPAYYRVAERGYIQSLEAQLAREVQSLIQGSSCAARMKALSVSLDRLEAALSQAWNAIPEGPFFELDPGCVELWGRELAQGLLAQRVPPESRSSFAERLLRAFMKAPGMTLIETLSQHDNVEEVKESLIATAMSELGGPFTLSDVLQAITRMPNGRERLARHLEALADVARSVVRLRRGLRMDKSLSPETLSIGLPGGAHDVQADLIKRTFPHGTLFVSSDDNTIEVVYDISNLSNDQLLSHELTREAYEEANTFERDRLWHFPPKEVDAEIRYLAVSKKRCIVGFE